MSPMDSSPLDHSDSGPGMLVGCSILAFISTAVFILRVWARRLTRQPFALDDYLCLAALIIQHALLAAAGVMVVKGGLGRDTRITAAENPNSVVIFFQGLFAGEITYTYSSPLIKLSVLAFYWRVFPTPYVKLGCKVIGTLNIAWCIAITILDFVQCRPLKAFWLIELQALPTTHCLDSTLCFLGNSIANCVIDFFTLTLPIHEILKLHISTKQKITIGCVFLLGGVAFAASLVRSISTGIMVRDGVTNFGLQFVPSGTATVVEIYAAVIGACMPTVVPVYRKLRYGDPLKSHASAVLSKQTSGKGSSTRQKQYNNEEGSFERLSGGDNNLSPVGSRLSRRVDISTGRKGYPLGYAESESYQMGGVMVTQNIIWSENKHGDGVV